MKVFATLLPILVACAAAAPVVVESIDKIPPGWDEIGSPSPDKFVKLSMAIRSEDDQLFERTVHEISDPSHPSYGKHLSREEAKALLKPTTEATDSVRRWLSDAGIPAHQVRDDGQWLHAHVSVVQAERLLATQFAVFARDEDRVVRTREYSVPEEVRPHIVTIQPTTFFGASEQRGSGNTRQSTKAKRGCLRNGGGHQNACETEVTPPCIRELYNLPDNYTGAHPRSLLGVVGFRKSAAQYDQLEEFLERFDPQSKGANFSVALVNGGKNPQGQGDFPTGEANLNIQYAVSLANRIPVRYYSVGGEYHDFNPDLDLPSTDFVEPYLEFASHLLDLPDEELPQVVSISYGVYEQHLPREYARTVCNMFGQLGARGVSVIGASGNFGPGYSCLSNDGRNTTKFMPEWPGVCPYVTSVGGTQINGTEVAWSESDGSSGGSFSEYWPRPTWQNCTIEKYLARHGDEWKGYFNEKGRAYPDVAALAAGYQTMNAGEVEATGGTSAATPAFAAMIALINNERFKKGKPSLGFLNPWIYQIGDIAFSDITKGKSTGCKGMSLSGDAVPSIPDAGWAAVEGWDPITGFGSPIFDRLMELAT